jgi:uncharacterized NAD(P)/FAD-binding protein YdhS
VQTTEQPVAERPVAERPAAEHPDDRGITVAVVGGGASGTLTVVHLLRRAAAEQVPVRVVLLDRLGRHGMGQAYSTTHPDHLLNSPAERMSALSGDPQHLVRWARAAGVAHDGFLSRHDYGHYLRDLLADAQDRAGRLGQVSRLTSDVAEISDAGPHRPLGVHLAGGGRIEADLVVLATGSPGRTIPFPVPPGPRFVAEPWAPGALDRIGDGSPVVVMGTGLTMIDVALAIRQSSPRTIVHAVSRHGLLPRVHAALPRPAGMAGLPAIADLPPDVRLAPLIRRVRSFVAQYPGCWQDAVDALRPELAQLWQRLSPADRRQFVRHVARYWEVHRHRMPPASARKIAELRAAGRLQLIQGRVVAAAAEGPALRVSIDQGDQRFDLTAGWLVDATGPATDIARTPDPLFRSLLRTGLARPDPLRLGIDADSGGAILDSRGRPSARVFTLGPTLRGLRYETTAIPEIREQAAALADRLIATAWSRAAEGTARSRADEGTAA